MLFRCRICDEEYTILEVIGILDDDLCPECENTVLETMAEWEQEEERRSQENKAMEEHYRKYPHG